MNPDIDALLGEVRRARELTDPATARRIRLDADVTQERLAAAVGVDRTTLARWESGATRPHARQRARWLEALEALRQELVA